MPFRRHRAGIGGLTVLHHELDTAAQHPFVQGKCLFAPAVKPDIWGYFQGGGTSYGGKVGKNLKEPYPKTAGGGHHRPAPPAGCTTARCITARCIIAGGAEFPEA